MLAVQLEEQQLAASARLIAAEAGGRSWLQRNWRPITMLRFLALVIADSGGLLAFRLLDQAVQSDPPQPLLVPPILRHLTDEEWDALCVALGELMHQRNRSQLH